MVQTLNAKGRAWEKSKGIKSEMCLKKQEFRKHEEKNIGKKKKKKKAKVTEHPHKRG